MSFRKQRSNALSFFDWTYREAKYDFFSGQKQIVRVKSGVRKIEGRQAGKGLFKAKTSSVWIKRFEIRQSESPLANYHLAYSYSAYSRASRSRNAISQHLKVIAEKKYDERECVSGETGNYQNGYLPRNENFAPSPYSNQKKKTASQHPMMAVILSPFPEVISPSRRHFLGMKMKMWYWQKQSFKHLLISSIWVSSELSLPFWYVQQNNDVKTQAVVVVSTKLSLVWHKVKSVRH